MPITSTDTRNLRRKRSEKGGDENDQRDNKNRYNGNYNGFTNYYLLVIGYEVKLLGSHIFLGLPPI